MPERYGPWSTFYKGFGSCPGVATGGKIAFDVRKGEIVVSRVETTHEDPAICAFVGLLEADFVFDTAHGYSQEP